MTSSKPSRAEQKRARIQAAQAALAAAGRRQRRTRLGLGAGAVLVVVALIVVGVLVSGGNGNGGSSVAAAAAIPSTPATTATGRTSNPPWAVPADVSGSVAKAGLPMLGAEGTAEHIHVHLDVRVNGQPVTVPAEVGIDNAAQKISPLHTHDTTGVIHVESPKPANFSLGQFFTEWQVALSSTGVGGLTADGSHQFQAYVNGKPQTGDPAGIIFHAHDEIALVYGSQANVPSSYKFAAGL